MCIKDNPRYINCVNKGWITPDVDICLLYYYDNSYCIRTFWDAYVDERFGEDKILQFVDSGETPEEALDNLFNSIEAWYAPVSE